MAIDTGFVPRRKSAIRARTPGDFSSPFYLAAVDAVPGHATAPYRLLAPTAFVPPANAKVINRGYGTFEGDEETYPDGFYFLPPRGHWGKPGTLPRVPRTAVLAGDDLIGYDPDATARFALRYAADIAPLGVAVYYGGQSPAPLSAASFVDTSGTVDVGFGVVYDVYSGYYTRTALTASLYDAGDVLWVGRGTPDRGFLTIPPGYVTIPVGNPLAFVTPDHDFPELADEYAARGYASVGGVGATVYGNETQMDDEYSLIEAFAARCRSFKFLSVVEDRSGLGGSQYFDYATISGWITAGRPLIQGFPWVAADPEGTADDLADAIVEFFS